MLIMLIARQQTISPTPIKRLAADLRFRFAHVLGQNGLGNRGMGDRSNENYWRRLVDRNVRFIISGLREVDLRDRGD